jgi:hypothetical protein
MVEYLLLNFRFIFSILIIRVPASSSACISASAILSNLSIFLLICFKTRLRKIFSFLNAARISYIGFRRFPASISIKILIVVFRSVIIIPIYVFTAERFMLKFIIAFWLRRSYFWFVITIFLTRFWKSLETKIILFIIVEILSIFSFAISSWLSRKKIFFWNTIRIFFRFGLYSARIVGIDYVLYNFSFRLFTSSSFWRDNFFALLKWALNRDLDLWFFVLRRSGNFILYSNIRKTEF